MSSSSPIIHLATPYLLFIGDAKCYQDAKTSFGIARWRPDQCIGQFRYPECEVDFGIPDLSLKEARERGAKTFVLGAVNAGGFISEQWKKTVLEAIEYGFDVASGLHDRLNADPDFRAAAVRKGTRLIDVRDVPDHAPTGNGARRGGRRLLTVGTDCSVGKMFATLAIEKEMRQRGIQADFVATGQTGILINGTGVAIDAVVSDFISGTVEALAPEHPDPEHWYLIEGQGSLFHPAYAGVSLGLLHGAQPDRMILCHDPSRTHIRRLVDYPQPDILDCVRRNEEAARLTNPDAKVVGCALNTSYWDEGEATRFIAEFEDRHQLPATDAYRFGAAKLVDAIIESM